MLRDWWSDSLTTGLSLWAQAEPQTLFERLGNRDRARVLAAFGIIFVLALFLLAFVRLGARMARGYMNLAPPPRLPIPSDDWATKPLVPPIREHSRKGTRERVAGDDDLESPDSLGDDETP